MKRVLAVFVICVVTVLTFVVAPADATDRPRVIPGSPEAQAAGCIYNVPQLHGKAGPFLIWDGPNGEYVTVHNYIQVIRSTNCYHGVRAYTAWHIRKNGQPVNGGATLTHSVEQGTLGFFVITPVENFGSTGPDGEGSTVSAWLSVGDPNDGYRGTLDVQRVVVAGTPSGSNHYSVSGWVGFP